MKLHRENRGSARLPVIGLTKEIKISQSFGFRSHFFTPSSEYVDNTCRAEDLFIPCWVSNSRHNLDASPDFTAATADWLILYANDVPSFYCNNQGANMVEIRRQ